MGGTAKEDKAVLERSVGNDKGTTGGAKPRLLAESQVRRRTNDHPFARQRLRDREREVEAARKLRAFADKHEKKVLEVDRDLDQIIDMFPGRDYSERLTRAVFTLWPDEPGQKGYDQHMVKHVRAIERNIRAAMAIEKMISDYDEPRVCPPMFGPDILEMSCGSASVIELICNNAPPALVRKMRITANDITPRMKELARDKLEALPIQPRQIRYTCNDIRSSLPEGQYDIIGLFQTLHLLTDPELLRQEIELGIVNPKHTQIKSDTISRAIQSHLKFNGSFMMGDEWDPGLSSGTGGLISVLFRKLFKPMDIEQFRNMMREIRGARFRAQLKARIDSYHSMYLWIFRLDPDKLNNRGVYLPEADRYVRYRRKATNRVIESVKVSDPFFRRSYKSVKNRRRRRRGRKRKQKKMGPWVPLRPFGEGPTLRVNYELPRFSKDIKYGTIILVGIMHKVNDRDRLSLITECVEHLRLGGSLLFVDEWTRPQSSQFHCHKNALRTTMKTNFERCMVFETAVREHILNGFDSGMYGFLYRKKAD